MCSGLIARVSRSSLRSVAHQDSAWRTIRRQLSESVRRRKARDQEKKAVAEPTTASVRYWELCRRDPSSDDWGDDDETGHQQEHRSGFPRRCETHRPTATGAGVSSTMESIRMLRAEALEGPVLGEPGAQIGTPGRRRAGGISVRPPSSGDGLRADPWVEELSTQGRHACGRCSEPARKAIFRGGAGSDLGHGYHRYPDLRGVALSGGRRGSILPDRRRLVDEVHIDAGPGRPGCPADGRLAPSPQSSGSLFTPIKVAEYATDAVPHPVLGKGPRPYRGMSRRGNCFRQRCGGIVFQQFEERADTEEDLSVRARRHARMCSTPSRSSTTGIAGTVTSVK